MTELDSAVTTSGAQAGWTCGRCEMTLRWMPDAANPALPSTWVEEDGSLYCLSCRRERAGDEALARLPVESPADVRQRARSQARLEFEIQRDPERPDNRIARTCHTSTPAVRKARARLGLHAAPRE
jgi:hypothetical protein